MITRLILLAGVAFATAAQAEPPAAPVERVAVACQLRPFHSPPGRAHLWERVGDCDTKAKTAERAAQQDQGDREQRGNA